MVSTASNDLPDPDKPVKTISLSRGNSRVRFLRLCSRAPRMRIVSVDTETPPVDSACLVNDASVVQVGGERMFDQSAGWTYATDTGPDTVNLLVGRRVSVGSRSG